MKKLFLAMIAAVALMVPAFGQTTTTTTVVAQPTGQVSAQSQTVEVTSTAINFLYLRDGFDNYAALAIPAYTFEGTGGKLKLNLIGAFEPNDITKRAYVGTGLSYDLFASNEGWKFTLYAGLKGVNVADNFRFQDGDRGWVFGIGASLPLKF